MREPLVRREGERVGGEEFFFNLCIGFDCVLITTINREIFELKKFCKINLAFTSRCVNFFA